MDIAETRDELLQASVYALRPQILEEIVCHKKEAIAAENELLANVLWCYEQIYIIKDIYLSAYLDMRRAARLSNELDENGYESPKSRAYEDAWNKLDCADKHICLLEENYCIPDIEMKEFHIDEIANDIQKLFSLFPYKVFCSREMIIKREECSICGKPIRVRHPCGHIPGRLYMGVICIRKVVEAEALAISIVDNPFDRYAILKMRGVQFDFSLLDFIVPKIQPYTNWGYNIEERLLHKFEGIGRNELCPCGSGKKFKHCIRDERDKHYRRHYGFYCGANPQGAERRI